VLRSSGRSALADRAVNMTNLRASDEALGFESVVTVIRMWRRLPREFEGGTEAE
jgi:hypothetical protein